MTDPLFSVADRVVLVTGGSRGLGRAMCLGLAERGARVVIRVNSIICGTFDTDAAAGFVHNADLLPEILRPIALGRIGRPEEILGAVVYLLSDASTYTTGSLMTIDGGVSG
jgi:NAD(P)-dependent dehydrogenase (short-subunit alcohol dehydrogenase family)